MCILQLKEKKKTNKTKIQRLKKKKSQIRIKRVWRTPPLQEIIWAASNVRVKPETSNYPPSL